jgi:formyltetrahydrofolate synthetase
MATHMPSSLEIAQEAELRPIAEIAEDVNLEPDEYDLYGNYKAKVGLDVLERLKDVRDGKLICVTAITPTKAGEGKTTTSVSLTQGLGHIGKKVALCLREASLGPVFGIKGGAASTSTTARCARSSSAWAAVRTATCERRASTSPQLPR